MQFDKLTVDKICAEIVAVSQPIAAKYGITIHDGGGSFDELQASLRIKLTTTSDKGETVEQRDWKQYATLYDLKPEWLGKPVTISGTPFLIAGFCPRRRKNPVLIINQHTKNRHVTSINTIRRFFGEKPTGIFATELERRP